jgi:hypothetical protein
VTTNQVKFIWKELAAAPKAQQFSSLQFALDEKSRRVWTRDKVHRFSEFTNLTENLVVRIDKCEYCVQRFDCFLAICAI